MEHFHLDTLERMCLVPVTANIGSMLRVRASSALGLDAKCRSVVDILGGNQLSGSNVLLNPGHQSQNSVVLAVSVTRHTLNIVSC